MLNNSFSNSSKQNNVLRKNEIFKSVQIECLNHISKAYNSLRLSNYIAKVDEVQITADLFSEATAIPAYSDFRYTISPERPDYIKEIRERKKSPKKARKYDIFFENWDCKNRISFGMEAKLLIEQNYQSKKPAKLIKEYISDVGMGKYIKGIYEEPGCMLGYILQGDIHNIVEKINSKIVQVYDNQQCLTKVKNKNLNHTDVYISLHINKLDYDFYHLMFDFG